MTDLGLLQTLIISFIFTLDAFFVSVAYGMSGISLKKTFTLASLVSLFCGISIVLGLFNRFPVFYQHWYYGHTSL